MIDSASTIFTEELYRIAPRPVVILTKPWPAVLPAEIEQLSKILSALKLSLERVTILYQQKFDFTSLVIKPERVIYFGPLPAGLTHYECIEAQGVKIVASEDLGQLLTNDPARKRLWIALKQLFAL
jgi:DNA polymerase III psi subunit